MNKKPNSKSNATAKSNTKPKAKPKKVSLAGAASGKTVRKKRKINKRLWWIAVPVLLVIVLLVVLLVRRCGASQSSSTAREIVQYNVTPDELSSDVSYFTIGVLGESSTDRMDMVAVVCYDRKAGAASVMQMPVVTYIGEDGAFAASVYGDVWGNPKPITWCNTCRRSVSADDIAGTTHSTCGTTLTTRAGSAFGDFNRVINAQYGLPTDNYLVIPRNGLIQLIDAVGGVEVTLDKTMSLDGIEYQQGVRTLKGKAAVAYAITSGYTGSPESDRERLLRQRQVMAGLLSRLSGYKLDELYNTDPKRMDVLSNIMSGRYPLRYDDSVLGKARLMGASESKADSTKSFAALADFLYDISHVDAKNITVFTLPGSAQKLGTETVYSVNRTQAIELLNRYMNPHGLTLDDSTVKIPQLNQTPQDVDAAVNTLDAVMAG